MDSQIERIRKTLPMLQRVYVLTSEKMKEFQKIKLRRTLAEKFKINYE